MMFNIREISKECAKGFLLLMNVLCILLAILILACAAVDARILKQYGEEHAIGTFAGDLIIIVICILLIAVAIVGCVGVVKENVKLLYLYTGFIMILVVLELFVGIYVAVQRCGLQIRVSDFLREYFFENVTGEDLSLHERFWDDIQTRYECCGLNGPEDYPAIDHPITLSCCPRAYRARVPHAQQQLYKACLESHTYYGLGCEEEILYSLQLGGEFLLGAAVISFWLEAGGLLMAMWVANNIKNCVVVYKNTVKY